VILYSPSPVTTSPHIFYPIKKKGKKGRKEEGRAKDRPRGSHARKSNSMIARTSSTVSVAGKKKKKGKKEKKRGNKAQLLLRRVCVRVNNLFFAAVR